MKAIHLTAAILPVLFQNLAALTPARDAFGGGAVDSSRWQVFQGGNASIAPSGGRAHYVAAKPTGEDDFAGLSLRNNNPGYNESWQVILDVTNSAGQGDNVGIGIMIGNAADQYDNVNLEFYGKGSRGGFNFIGVTDDNDDPSKDISVNPQVTHGSLRITFSKKTKLFTFWQDSTGPADGYQWSRLCTFSPTGRGGDRRGNWRMNNTSGRFTVNLYGYSEYRAVSTGKVTFDNFVLKAAK